MYAVLEPQAQLRPRPVSTKPPYRVLVTGSRHCSPREAEMIREVLQRVCAPALRAGRPVRVVHGQCPYGGVDQVADEWAEQAEGVTPEPHPADFAFRGKVAGPMRNSEMVAWGADIFLAFPGPMSVGTWDCVKKAAAAKIPGQVYPIGPRHSRLRQS